MLIDEDGVTIGVHYHEACRASRSFIGFGCKRNTLRLQLTLQLSHVCEGSYRLRVSIPTGVECEDVLLKHALKKSDNVIAVFEDDKLVRGLPVEHGKAKFLIKRQRFMNIFHRQTDRKRTKFHHNLLQNPTKQKCF